MNVAEFRSILLSAPQASHFSDQAIANLHAYLERLGEDHAFHANRLFGIGGSEVGAIIEWYCDSHFQTAYRDASEIASEKLLDLFPQKANQYTARGTELETLVRDAFHLRYGVQTEEQTLHQVRRHKTLPIGANLDDLVVIDGQRIIPDYKTNVGGFSYHPGSEVARGDDLPLAHLAQLHSYVSACRSHDIQVHQTAIVGLHCDEDLFEGLRGVVANKDSNPEQYGKWVEILAENSIRGASLTLYPVEINEEFIELIETVIPRFWNDKIMSGKGVEKTSNVELSQAEKNSLLEELTIAQESLAAQKAAEAVLEQSKSNLKSLASGLDVANNQITTGVASITRRNRFDEKKAYRLALAKGEAHEDLTESTDKIDVHKLVRAFEALGGDVDDPSLRETKLNTKRLKEAMLLHDIDPGDYFSTTIGVELTRKKKGTEAEEKQSQIDAWKAQITNSSATSDHASAESVNSTSQTSLDNV